ncbi:MAG: hypothetical protein E3J87_03615 [Candidatus Cloacimonadota bacterium]|nr:MAG: hypothetical protein E3J87_03615 [Candidatus Cloacimonadota bacterium]
MKDDVFRQIVDIISKYNCKWWLDAGTCLAVMRGDDFITQAEDVDIGLLSIHTSLWDFFIMDFTAIGFQFSKGRTYKGYRVTLGFVGPEKLDIFFYYEKDDYLWHPIHGRESEQLPQKVYKPEKFSKHLFDNLKEVSFKDRLCYLPNPPGQYLLERYGENWREPNPNYKFWRDSKAIDMEFA